MKYHRQPDQPLDAEPGDVWEETDEDVTTIEYDTSRNARRTDPETSHEAAHSIVNTAESLRIRILRVYEHHPLGLTAEEAAFFSWLDLYGTTKRNSELKQLKYIEFAEEYRLSSKGRRQRVHRITDAGRAYLLLIDRKTHDAQQEGSV